MASTSSHTTRKKVLALKAERLQKEIDLIKTQEDLAALGEDSHSIDSLPASLSSTSSSFSLLGSQPILDESEILHDKLIASSISKKLADDKMKFYEADYQKAQTSKALNRIAWMTASKEKFEKHHEAYKFESSVVADCARRLAALSTPTANPTLPAALDHSFLPAMEHKPVFDGHSG
jgi:hypothetical protein